MQTPTKRLIALSVFLAAVFIQGCDRTPSVIKIGVAQPLTGNLAPQGQDLLNGVKLAVEELNREGYKIQGKAVTIELVAVDDRANADTGREVAQQLVDAGVVAVIGHLNSGVSIAAAPIYASKGIAQLAISTNPMYTRLGLDTTFRLVANDVLQAKAMGGFAVSQFPTANNFALLDDGTPYGKDLAAGAGSQLKEASKNILVQQSLDDKTTKFDELAEKLKSNDIEVVVSTLNDFQINALLESLKKISFTNIKILGGDTIKTTVMLKGVGIASGLFATSPILEVREFPAGGAFLEKYRAKYKVDPAYAGHYTYDAMYVLASAIQRAESTKPKDIVTSLRKIDGYAPVTGSMKWNEKGEQRYGVIGVYSATDELWELQMRSDTW